MLFNLETLSLITIFNNSVSHRRSWILLDGFWNLRVFEGFQEFSRTRRLHVKIVLSEDLSTKKDGFTMKQFTKATWKFRWFLWLSCIVQSIKLIKMANRNICLNWLKKNQLSKLKWRIAFQFAILFPEAVGRMLNIFLKSKGMLRRLPRSAFNQFSNSSRSSFFERQKFFKIALLFVKIKTRHPRIMSLGLVCGRALLSM